VVAGLAAALFAVALSVQPAFAAEHSLAGVKIFTTAKALLMKFGTPTTIVTSGGGGGGGAAASPFGNGGSSQPFPGGGGNMQGGMPPWMQGGNMQGGRGMPGGGADDNGPMGGQQNASAPIGNSPNIVAQQPGEVTWIYDRPNGVELQFTLDATGRVIQIRATGARDGVTTAKNVSLGASYQTIIDKYGWPESQSQQSGILTTMYVQRSHVAFQFYDNRLVGIVVAAVE
jgi:hypothetical protein